jgi:hypothetical protein
VAMVQVDSGIVHTLSTCCWFWRHAGCKSYGVTESSIQISKESQESEAVCCRVGVLARSSCQGNAWSCGSEAKAAVQTLGRRRCQQCAIPAEGSCRLCTKLAQKSGYVIYNQQGGLKPYVYCVLSSTYITCDKF